MASPNDVAGAAGITNTHIERTEPTPVAERAPQPDEPVERRLFSVFRSVK
jgi:hypothetical protein